MNSMVAFSFKLFHEPVLPARGTCDLAPPLIMLVLLAAGAVLMRRRRPGPGRQWQRHVVQVLSTMAFVFGLHPCACMVRDLINGAREVGIDSLEAYSLLMMIVPVVAFTIVWGRVFCGWVCPIGFIQEMVTKATAGMRRSPVRERALKVRFAMGVALLVGTVIAYLYVKPSGEPILQGLSAGFLFVLSVLVVLSVMDRRWEVKLRTVRYVVLAFFVVSTVLDVYLQAAFCVLFTNDLRQLGWLLFGGVLLASLILPQAWCRFMCPEGALLSLVTKLSGWKIRLNDRKCSACNVCNEVCPVEAIEIGRVDEKSCLYCCKCVDACPINALDMAGESSGEVES